MEINTRANYPVKACLIEMEERGEIDMESSLHKYCVSWFAIRVYRVGTSLAVQAWNDHPVPGIAIATCFIVCSFLQFTQYYIYTYI